MPTQWSVSGEEGEGLKFRRVSLQSLGTVTLGSLGNYLECLITGRKESGTFEHLVFVYVCG